MANTREEQIARAMPAIESLKNYQQQLDADGCMVGVSRQALDETLAFVAAILSTEAAPSEPVAWIVTDAQVNSACMSYRHDFGLMSPDKREKLRFEAREWLHAWLKEGIGCDRNEVIERCAAVVDQANREGPYQAIAAASRIRALRNPPAQPDTTKSGSE